MRANILIVLLLGLALSGLAPAVSSQTTGSVVTADVTLRVAPDGFVVPSHWAVGNQAIWLVDPAEDATFNDQDGIAGCQLTVPDADGDDTVDGGEVLDEATATGCISGWDHETSDCCGRYVTSVDGRDEVGWPAPWWMIQLNGQSASVGIDGMALEDGDALSLVYHIGA